MEAIMATNSAAMKPVISKGPDMLDARRFTPASRKRLSAPGLGRSLPLPIYGSLMSSSAFWSWACHRVPPITTG
ncbi:hypothetical protein AX23_11500 [Brucella melitensis 548]|nr:hypothetical protein AX23_11500 [Brucella melitensis 548]